MSEQFEEESAAGPLRRWISAGDIIVMVSSLIAIGISYGTLATRLDSVQDDVSYLRGRDITPGAERRIAVLEARVEQQRQDALDTRREIRSQLDRIEAKLDSHLQVGNGGMHP